MLTTEAVAMRYKVTPMTVRRWCLLGLLAGAVRVGVDPRITWLIPESALQGFEPPRRGRPKQRQ
jgi:hypothetical protein